jgi:hypothetical protein
MMVDPKHIAPFCVPDFINYYLTSNHPHAFYVDEHDRRFFIHEVQVGKSTPEFYDQYFGWLRNGGPAALLHYFQEILDYGNFSPKAPPPMTAAKSEMVDGVRSEVDAWLLDVEVDDSGRELFTSAELCSRYNAATTGKRMAPNTFGMHLKKRFQPIGAHRVSGVVQRLYAIANADKWKLACAKEVADHVESTKKF